MRKDIETKKIGLTRKDYQMLNGKRVVKDISTSEHDFISIMHLQSDVIRSDGFTPTPYKGIRLFSGNGNYHRNGYWTQVRGPAFSFLTNHSFPWIGVVSPNSFWNYDPPAHLSDNAVISAINKAANINFNGLVALGEARSTADTLSTTVKQILGIAVAIKKLDYKKVKKIIKGNRPVIVGHGKGKISKKRYNKMMRKKFSKKDLYAPSDLWLQYRYGIMPLINDSNAIAEALSGMVERRMTQKTVGGQKRNHSYSSEWDGTKTETEYKLTSYFHILFDVSSPEWAVRSENGFAHIPLAMWELVPFSFVADWASPIGKWLTTLSTIPHISMVHAFYGYKVKATVNKNHYSVGTLGPLTWNNSARFEAYKRVPVPKIPMPLPRFRAPIKGISDLDKIADIFALLRQLTK